MIGRLNDLFPGTGNEQTLTITVKADFRERFDELKNTDVEVEIKRYRPKRSLDANAYCWVLCERIAERLSDERQVYTKDDIYREAVRNCGVYRDFQNLTAEEAKTLRRAWSMLGTGWVTEQVDYSQDGERATIRCYYGSSQYNSKQMSRLIDGLVQDCQSLGIPVETPDQIEQMKSLWAQAPVEKENLDGKNK